MRPSGPQFGEWLTVAQPTLKPDVVMWVDGDAIISGKQVACRAEPWAPVGFLCLPLRSLALCGSKASLPWANCHSARRCQRARTTAGCPRSHQRGGGGAAGLRAGGDAPELRANRCARLGEQRQCGLVPRRRLRLRRPLPPLPHGGVDGRGALSWRCKRAGGVARRVDAFRRAFSPIRHLRPRRRNSTAIP